MKKNKLKALWVHEDLHQAIRMRALEKKKTINSFIKELFENE